MCFLCETTPFLALLPLDKLGDSARSYSLTVLGVILSLIKGVMNFDDIIGEIGEFGPYQKRVYFLVCLAFIPHAMGTLGIIFTMGSQDHRCAIPDVQNDTYETMGTWHQDLVSKWIPKDSSGGYSPCLIYSQDAATRQPSNLTVGCSKYVFDESVFESSIASDADMLCERKSLSTYANMIFMAGMVLGSFFFGTFSDRFGRKKALMVCVLGQFIVSLSTAFVSDYVTFILLRFATASFGIGLILTSFVTGMEIVGPKTRTIAGIVIELFWVLGMFFNVLLAYFIRNWRILQIVTSLPAIFLLSYSCLLPESPRWLILKKRYKEATSVIEKAARLSNVTLSKKARDALAVEPETTAVTKTLNLSHMFSSKFLLITTLVQIYYWHITSLVYFGLTLNVSSLYGDIYLNFTLNTLVEGASYLLCLLCLEKVGRKPFLVTSMMVAGLSCLATIFPVIYGSQDTQWLVQALSLLGKFGASISFAVAFVYAAEVFPTTVRNSGIGVCSLSARVAGIMAPYIADLGKVVPKPMGIVLPLIVFGGGAVLASLLSLLLPETRHRTLPDNIHDTKSFQRKSTPVNVSELERLDTGNDATEDKSSSDYLKKTF